MDEQIWFYIIAAVIYFLTRKKKKKQQPEPQRPTTENRPQQEKRPVSFEELLREITEGRTEEHEAEERQETKPEPVEEPQYEEGRTRRFSDEESKRVYEESIKLAEGYDIAFEPDEHFASKKLFKDTKVEEPTLADEIRESLRSTDSARKAIIYSEILNRKY